MNPSDLNFIGTHRPQPATNQPPSQQVFQRPPSAVVNGHSWKVGVQPNSQKSFPAASFRERVKVEEPKGTLVQRLTNKLRSFTQSGVSKLGNLKAPAIFKKIISQNENFASKAKPSFSGRTEQGKTNSNSTSPGLRSKSTFNVDHSVISRKISSLTPTNVLLKGEVARTTYPKPTHVKNPSLLSTIDKVSKMKFELIVKLGQDPLPMLTGHVEVEKSLPNSKETKTVTYNPDKYITRGGAGYIFAVKTENNKEAVLKVEIGSPEPLLKGDEILNRLLEGIKKVPGLVPKNKQVVYLDEGQTGKRVGILQKKYDGDLGTGKINQLPVKTKLDICFQLASGLSFLQEKDFYHGDLKPVNILFTEKNGKIQADIGDVEDGQFLNSEELAHHEFSGTRGFTLGEDMDHRILIMRKINAGGELGPEDVAFMKAMDIYSLGATYKSLFLLESQETRENAAMYIEDPTGPIGTSKITDEQAQENRIPEDVKVFINLMLHSNSQLRPTSEQVKQFFTMINQNQ